MPQKRFSRMTPGRIRAGSKPKIVSVASLRETYTNSFAEHRPNVIPGALENFVTKQAPERFNPKKRARELEQYVRVFTRPIKIHNFLLREIDKQLRFDHPEKEALMDFREEVLAVKQQLERFREMTLDNIRRLRNPKQGQF